MANTVLGIDVSHWQNEPSTAQVVDFKKAYAKGARFVFIKASQANWKDSDIAINWENAHEAGLLRGAYHFLTWDIHPEVQADYFCKLIENDPGELPPTADFEWWKTTPSNAITVLEKFLKRVESNLGRIPMIYTAPGFWNQFGSKLNSWAHYYLWIAHWDVYIPSVPKPWTDWTFWQFSSKGDGLAFGAESKNIDLDYFNGTLDELYRFAQIPLPQPSLVDLTSWALEIDEWARGQGYSGPKPKS